MAGIYRACSCDHLNREYINCNLFVVSTQPKLLLIIGKRVAIAIVNASIRRIAVIISSLRKLLVTLVTVEDLLALVHLMPIIIRCRIANISFFSGS